MSNLPPLTLINVRHLATILEACDDEAPATWVQEDRFYSGFARAIVVDKTMDESPDIRHQHLRITELVSDTYMPVTEAMALLASGLMVFNPHTAG